MLRLRARVTHAGATCAGRSASKLSHLIAEAAEPFADVDELADLAERFAQ